jgi:hypothetical protein
MWVRSVADSPTLPDRFRPTPIVELVLVLLQLRQPMHRFQPLSLLRLH